VPGGLGKVTVLPDWVVRREGRATTFRTYTGRTAEYLDPEETGPIGQSGVDSRGTDP
jgi:hypothetical protein